MSRSTVGTLLGTAFALGGMFMYDAEPSGMSIFFIVTGSLMLRDALS